MHHLWLIFHHKAQEVGLLMWPRHVDRCLCFSIFSLQTTWPVFMKLDLTRMGGRNTPDLSNFLLSVITTSWTR